MAKHTHLVLDFEESEIFGIALPVDGSAGAGPGNEPRIREALSGTINGSNTVFTTVTGDIDRSVTGKEEVVIYNGQWLTEGASNDYVASESGGVGTGYDTITFAFAPRVGDRVEITYIPA